MDAFEKIATGREACLADAALVFAADAYPDLDFAIYREQLQLMVEGFDIFLAGVCTPRGVLQMLNEFFFRDLDFTGNCNDYYDPRNSYLNEVIDRRRGIPISLSVLYRHLAESAGVRLEGMNFPGHFMLAFEPGAGHRLYIDVFNEGAWLEWDECLARIREFAGDERPIDEDDFRSMTDREILGRMLRNLKGIYWRDDPKKCLQVQERLVRLFPRDPNEHRDLGVLYLHAGRPVLAVRTLQDLIRRHPPAGEQPIIREYLANATREAVLVN